MGWENKKKEIKLAGLVGIWKRNGKNVKKEKKYNMERLVQTIKGFFVVVVVVAAAAAAGGGGRWKVIPNKYKHRF